MVAMASITHEGMAVEHGCGTPSAYNSSLLLPVILLLFGFAPLLRAQEQRWTSLGPEGGTINALAIDPKTPTTMYAGSDFSGVFKSTDGGSNWSFAGPADLKVQALAIDPRTTTTLYAATWGKGVYKSTDGGGSWPCRSRYLQPTAGRDPRN